MSATDQEEQAVDQVDPVSQVVNLESSEKQLLHRDNLIGIGGFSRVYQGELAGQEPRVQVAVKVIKKKPWIQWKDIKKQPSVQWLKIKQCFTSKTKPSQSQIAEEAANEIPPEYMQHPLEIEPLPLSQYKIRQEIRNLRLLQENQHIIQLIGVCQVVEEVWIVTEWCVGPVELIYADLVDSRDREDLDQCPLVVHLMAPILSALLYIHELGYIHRDVKLGNILMAPTGVPKLIDLGLMTKIPPSSRKYSGKDHPGSPYYMPPEAVRKQALGPKSDAFPFALSVIKLHWRWDMLYIFSLFPWSDVMHLYTDHPADLPEVVKGLRSVAINPIDDEPSPGSWDDINQDLVKLIEIEAEHRGSLKDLAQNTLFKESMEDWRKYPCDPSRLSKRFLTQHSRVAVLFDETLNAAPMLLKYK